MYDKGGQRRINTQASTAVALDDATRIKFKLGIVFCFIAHHETQAVGIKPQDTVHGLGFI